MECSTNTLINSFQPKEKHTSFNHQISSRIRLATELDVPHLYKLITEMAEYHGLSQIFTTTETSLYNNLFKSPNPPFHSLTALILEISPKPFPQITKLSDHSTTFVPIIKNNYNLDQMEILDPELETYRSEFNDCQNNNCNVYVAGHVLVFPSYNGFFEKPGLFLDQMFVRKCYRGMRLGKLLFSTVAMQAEKMGMGMVDWLVADWNEETINFYEKMGAHYIPEYRLCKLYGDKLQAFGNKID
ncbi:putative isoleucine N-monooxygenase 1-like [Capsicum annuum]|uniref:L-ornithine N5-acetyltransferase NATA1-like n=1 Tax=Capsicum annuum TaxID=4072 RepID=UPI0007BEB394|nr:L-ornithine N5-acetyltransferase NATA1-like [Capsicum annuum]KAF3673069.1 putative isoleucine N-monooxygenase 1-like [Capsicum annuum]